MIFIILILNFNNIKVKNDITMEINKEYFVEKENISFMYLNITNVRIPIIKLQVIFFKYFISIPMNSLLVSHLNHYRYFDKQYLSIPRLSDKPSMVLFYW
jgi:hypothetical protein